MQKKKYYWFKSSEKYCENIQLDLSGYIDINLLIIGLKQMHVF